MISTMIEPTMRLDDRAAAAAEAVAAEHGCGQGRDLEADAGVGAGPAQARGEEDAGQRRQHARHDIGEAHRAPHRDADIVGGAARAADREDVPAGPRRVRKTWATIATMVATTTLNGTPSTEPSPK